MRKLSALIACACVALAAASTASAGPAFSVSDDAGKYARDHGNSFLWLLTTAGFSENRVTIRWDPSRPTTIVDKPFLDKYLPRASRAGIRIVFSVYPETATGITGTPNGQNLFVDFLTRVARTYPQVTKMIVGNEPNQPRFWQPQFNADGTGAAGAAYEALLAQSYDALKAVNPGIDVIGLGINSRGNDNPSATGNVSTSPVKFIRDMGAAYRASARSAPIMNEIAVHPYPAESTDPIDKGFRWPNVGFANLDRIKQEVWDAFEGTGQPVFAEGPAASPGGLTLRVDEIAWQTSIPASSAHAYTGAENVAVTDDQTQAAIYGDLIKESECDPSLSALSFFGFIDEPQLEAFQGGLVRADGTLRPSYDSVRGAIAETAGRCEGTEVAWQHTNVVVGAKPTWGKLNPRPARQTSWSFSATATEDATYRAGVFPVKGPRVARRAPIQRALATNSAPAALSMTGALKAYYVPRVKFAKRQLEPGWYVYAIRLTAAVNPARTSFFLSKPFRVGTGPA
jgi:hypothetical protein